MAALLNLKWHTYWLLALEAEPEAHTRIKRKVVVAATKFLPFLLAKLTTRGKLGENLEVRLTRRAVQLIASQAIPTKYASGSGEKTDTVTRAIMAIACRHLT